MIIICGSENNYLVHLYKFIDSVNKYINNKHKLIIYDLGIEKYDWDNLKKKYARENFIYKTFDYSKYPEWFNIKMNVGEYAWKPAIIYETYLEYKNEIIIWMDSGNLIHEKNLISLNSFINKNNIYSATSTGNIKKWTHPKTR